MTEKAIALQLADAIWPWPGISILADGQAKTLSLAAAELRRLHEVEQEHIEDQSVIAVWRGRTLRAEQQRDELLAALRTAADHLEGMPDPEDVAACVAKARAAIAKAEGKS
jgi:hypothetical protein